MQNIGVSGYDSENVFLASKMLVRHIEPEVAKRKKISMPTDGDLQRSLKEVLEEIADNLEQEAAFA